MLAPVAVMSGGHLPTHLRRGLARNAVRGSGKSRNRPAYRTRRGNAGYAAIRGKHGSGRALAVVPVAIRLIGMRPKTRSGSRERHTVWKVRITGNNSFLQVIEPFAVRIRHIM